MEFLAWFGQQCHWPAIIGMIEKNYTYTNTATTQNPSEMICGLSSNSKPLTYDTLTCFGQTDFGPNFESTSTCEIRLVK